MMGSMPRRMRYTARLRTQAMMRQEAEEAAQGAGAEDEDEEAPAAQV